MGPRGGANPGVRGRRRRRHASSPSGTGRRSAAALVPRLGPACRVLARGASRDEAGRRSRPPRASPGCRPRPSRRAPTTRVRSRRPCGGRRPRTKCAHPPRRGPARACRSVPTRSAPPPSSTRVRVPWTCAFTVPGRGPAPPSAHVPCRLRHGPAPRSSRRAPRAGGRARAARRPRRPRARRRSPPGARPPPR